MQVHLLVMFNIDIGLLQNATISKNNKFIEIMYDICDKTVAYLVCKYPFHCKA